MQSIATAVILAGGEGLRLRPLTSDRPKAMIMLAGKPILDWVIQWLVRNSITRIIVGVAYKKEVVIDHISKHSLNDVEFKFSEHTVEGGTGEGFRLAIERHVRDDTFLAMNGDEITDIKVPEFADFHSRHGGLATIAVSPLRSPFGVVEISGDTVTGFSEKPLLDKYVSTGVYVFDRKILEFLPVTGNIENETLPRLARARQLKAYRHQGFWGTVNTLKDLREIENELATRTLG